MDELLAAVREHAQKHYDEGWDVIVEAYEDDELVELIRQASSIDLETVLDYVGGVVEVLHEIRAERQRQPEAGWHY